MSRAAQANFKLYAPTGLLKFSQSVRMSDKVTVDGPDDNAGHSSFDGASPVYLDPAGGRDDLQKIRQEQSQSVMFRTQGTPLNRAIKDEASVVTQPLESSTSSANTSHLFRGNVFSPKAIGISQYERLNRSNLAGYRNA